jgi:hypothetical protein
MVVALLALPWVVERDRWSWLALFIGFFFVIALLLGTWVFPHYAAPAAGLFFVLVLLSMRRLHAWHLGTWRVGKSLVRGLMILFVISLFQVGAKMARVDRTRWYFQRQSILDKLAREPFKSLVIVRYAPTHNPNREWVYNAADIPDAKVILAREMGPQDKELLDHYSDRKAWVLYPDEATPRLEPYPGS